MPSSYGIARVRAFVKELQTHQQTCKDRAKLYLKQREIRQAKFEELSAANYETVLQMVERYFGPDALEKVKREGE